jgi:hypothetical protein
MKEPWVIAHRSRIGPVMYWTGDTGERRTIYSDDVSQAATFRLRRIALRSFYGTEKIPAWSRGACCKAVKL